MVLYRGGVSKVNELEYKAKPPIDHRRDLLQRTKGRLNNE